MLDTIIDTIRNVRVYFRTKEVTSHLNKIMDGVIDIIVDDDTDHDTCVSEFVDFFIYKSVMTICTEVDPKFRPIDSLNLYLAVYLRFTNDYEMGKFADVHIETVTKVLHLMHPRIRILKMGKWKDLKALCDVNPGTELFARLNKEIPA